ncbi:MAG TPA: thioredoxin domain-containing protein, partial [Gemmatimonadales bacterium]|nr:thioredoxin domain-containing protein [Gemmatimonadales bacterium]
MKSLFAAAVLIAVAAPHRATAQDSLLAARARGSKTAPVTVYEMADFACPYCRTFALTTLPLIQKEYIATGKVRWIFINMPLTQIHPNAERTAEFAACAGKQGKFWQTHDRLYSTQDQWDSLKDPREFLMHQIAPLNLDPKVLT